MAVRGSVSGRPVMRLLDVLGRRWVLRILWELRSGPQTFRALQALCDDLSPTVLNDRLKALRALDLVVAGSGGYSLTDRAERLAPLLLQLNSLADEWFSAPGPGASQ